MTPWIVRGDRVRYANNRKGPLGVVVGLVPDGVWVRWDGSSEAVKVKGLSRLDVLLSARRDRSGEVRGELDGDCLVIPASIGWPAAETPEPPSELDLWLSSLYPE